MAHGNDVGFYFLDHLAGRVSNAKLPPLALLAATVSVEDDPLVRIL
jgi:hypothetical protein